MRPATSIGCLILTIGLMTIEVRSSIGQCRSLTTMAPDGGALFDQSPYPNLDAAITIEINLLRQLWSVNPGVFYFDDGPNPNAMSSSLKTNPLMDGHIKIGWNLVLKECQELYTDCTVLPIIIAHEFAHTYAYFRSTVPGTSRRIRYNNKKDELYADYLAGAYMRHREVNFGGVFVPEVIEAFMSRGDYDFNSPGHHGTPEERYDALMAGYEFVSMANRAGVAINIANVSNKAYVYLKSVD